MLLSIIVCIYKYILPEPKSGSVVPKLFVGSRNKSFLGPPMQINAAMDGATDAPVAINVALPSGRCGVVTLPECGSRICDLDFGNQKLR